MFKKFNILTIAGMIVFIVLAFLFSYIQELTLASQITVIVIPVATGAISYFAFKTILTNTQPKRAQLLVMKLFAIKFFSYMAFALIYFIIEKTKSVRLMFIVFFFMNYIFNTLVLLTNTSKILKES